MQKKSYSDIIEHFKLDWDKSPLQIIKEWIVSAKNAESGGYDFKVLDGFLEEAVKEFNVEELTPALEEEFMIIAADCLLHIQEDMIGYGLQENITTTDETETASKNVANQV